jgi:hypothetical protein
MCVDTNRPNQWENLHEAVEYVFDSSDLHAMPIPQIRVVVDLVEAHPDVSQQQSDNTRRKLGQKHVLRWSPH